MHDNFELEDLHFQNKLDISGPAVLDMCLPTSHASAPITPIYFQACMGLSPLPSSVQALPISLVVAPFAFVAGMLVQYTATIFPTLAPLPVACTVFFSFARMFAQTWGITIGSTVLQNQLARTLPAQFGTRLFPASTQITGHRTRRRQAV
ncbi:hypothetical protein LXA43DRAFT_1091032 [Ganoderma leucocontextum]|nr:hypothetical protein LXA43DRAFT_1091032 [Ganoderma leucocontextum]